MTKRLILTFSIFVFLLLALGIAGVFVPKDFNSQEQVFFTIKRGEGLREIAKNLEQENLIYWSPLFKGYVMLQGKAGSLQAGPYFISPSMNMPEIIEKFVSGDIAKTSITIPEGFTSEQIREKLEDMTEDALLNLQEYEGYLFPDTYYIPYNAAENEVIKMMTDNFKRKTADLEVIPETVIMASILEKEVRTKEEKELAAGVLWRRLESNWPLQVDAHMWTYENSGLPAEPICNPGLESILAALYPKDSEYWYYISKPDGETIFQRTLQEHNYAKYKYLR
jgi:UPF0755 protein